MLKRSPRPRSGRLSLGQSLAIASPFALVLLLILLYWDSVSWTYSSSGLPRPASGRLCRRGGMGADGRGGPARSTKRHTAFQLSFVPEVRDRCCRKLKL